MPQPGHHDRDPGARRQPVADEDARDQRGEQRARAAIVTSTLATLVSVSATMKAVNITLQQTPEIQSARPPWRILREHRAALPERQDHQQRQQREEAAPEGDLEAARVLQVARDDAGGGPHQGHGDHQPDRAAVACSAMRSDRGRRALARLRSCSFR